MKSTIKLNFSKFEIYNSAVLRKKEKNRNKGKGKRNKGKGNSKFYGYPLAAVKQCDDKKPNAHYIIAECETRAS